MPCSVHTHHYCESFFACVAFITTSFFHRTEKIRTAFLFFVAKSTRTFDEPRIFSSMPAGNCHTCCLCASVTHTFHPPGALYMCTPHPVQHPPLRVFFSLHPFWPRPFGLWCFALHFFALIFFARLFGLYFFFGLFTFSNFTFFVETFRTFFGLGPFSDCVWLGWGCLFSIDLAHFFAAHKQTTNHKTPLFLSLCQSRSFSSGRVHDPTRKKACVQQRHLPFPPPTPPKQTNHQPCPSPPISARFGAYPTINFSLFQHTTLSQPTHSGPVWGVSHP